MPRRAVPALGLFLLAPLVGEYLLGNVPAEQIFALPVLAPMYGGGALLVREVTRRTGRGWPTMMVLALAYGVIEPGLFDHSLFNPSFQGLDARSSPTYVASLGISAAQALSFTVGHAVWSIGVPIAIVESLVPRRRTTPWLGKIGLSVAAAVYLLGGAIVFRWAQRTEDFLPSGPQLAAVVAVAVVLIGVAFGIGRRPGRRAGRRAPNPWLVGVVAFVASSVFAARDEDRPGIAIGVVLIAVTVVVVDRLSRRTGWGAAHRLALAGGALLTYAWVGFTLLFIKGTTSTVNLIGQAVLVVGALALLAAAARTVGKERHSQ